MWVAWLLLRGLRPAATSAPRDRSGKGLPGKDLRWYLMRRHLA